MRYTLEITAPMLQDAHKLAHKAMHASSFSEFKRALIDLNQTVRGYAPDPTVDFRANDEGVFNNGQLLWVAPTASAVEPLLEKAWKKSLEYDSEAKRATYLHHALYTIHPFKNGNGRVSRALYYYTNTQDTDFKNEVWCESEHTHFSGSHNNLIEAALKNYLANITHLPNASSLVLNGCGFDNPFYWRTAGQWSREMPKEYETLLKEKNGDCLRLMHDYTSMRFPHIVLLDFALKHGLIKNEDIKIDRDGVVRAPVIPERFMGMSQQGAEVMQALQNGKNAFVEKFLQDELGIINNLINKLPPPLHL